MTAVPETWTKVQNDKALPAGTYRILGAFRGPYNPVVTGTVKTVFRAKLELQGNDFQSFKASPPLYDPHTNAMGPWPFEVRFTRPAEQTPATAGVDGRVLLLIVAAIGIAVGIAVITSSVERLVDTLTKDVPDLFSPGTFVLVVLAIFLLTRARGRVST